MNHATRFTKLALLLIVAGALALAGCGGDDGVSQSMFEQEEMARAAAEEKAAAAEEEARKKDIAAVLANIKAATTVADAKAAYDALEDGVATDDEDVTLQAAVTAREMELEQAERDRLAALEEERQRAERERLAALEEERQRAEQERQRAERGRKADIDAALTAINTAATPEAAQAAYDAVKDQATAEEGDDLMQAIEARGTALAAIARTASQTEALMTAAGMVDTSDLMTQADIDAARMAVDALKAALDAAVDVSDAAKGMYLNQFTAADSAVMMAQSALDHATQMMALNDAVTALAAIDLTDLDTQAKVDAANGAIADLQMALDGATDLMDADKAAARGVLTGANQVVMAAQAGIDMNDAASQMMVLSDAADALGEINLTALPTQADIDAAQMAIDGLQAALDAATGLTEADKADAMTDLGLAKRRVAAAQTMLDDNIEAQTMALTTAGTALGDIALGLDDLSDQEAVTAAKTAVYALKMALEGATHVSDADKAMYMNQLTMAESAVMAAQSVLNHAAQTMVLTDAVDALGDIDLTNLSTQEGIDAAKAAITGLQEALEAATELTEAEKAIAMAELRVANRSVGRAEIRLNIATQMMALNDAVNTLAAIDLNDLMTQDQIDAADAAIVALDLALAAADLTDAQKLDATVDVTLAKRKVADARETLAGNIGDQKMALTTAGTALAAIDLEDLEGQEAITAARNAVDALKAALDGATHVSDADKAMYQTQFDAAEGTVRMAETGMDESGRMTAQRSAIMNAVTMARTAVAGVKDTSTDSEVAAADAAVKAVKDAIAAAEDLSEDDAEIISARAVLETIEPLLANAKTSRTAYLAGKGDEDMKANAALGKAMHAALAGPAGDGTDDALGNITAFTAGTHGITTAGLVLPIAENPGALTLAAADVTLDAGDSVGALGSWMGMDYAHSNEMTGDALITNEARVYTNKGPGKSQPFSGTGGKYTLITDEGATKDYVLLGEGNTPVTLAMGAPFAGSGTQTYTQGAEADAVYLSGTYDGAPGRFRCTGTCTVTNDGKGGPSALGGTWHFKPNAGAMVHQADAQYLYYGWWVSKDSKGMPTAASAFAGRFGTEATDDGLDVVDLTDATLTGSATYVGNAAGKFAITNVLDSTGNGGHFTADAMLEAKFNGEANPGVTGTIDNFRLNDGTENPGWSVSLARGALSTTGITAPAENPTVWSINGNKAAASGTWSGTMYDEAVTGDDNDGSNLPTTVIGTFYSEFSTIGRMVGGFGANKQ